MKKLVYLLCGLALSFSSIGVQAQSFITHTTDTSADFVRAGSTEVDVSNGIKSTSSTGSYIRWRVLSKTIPAGSTVSISFCDNLSCRSASDIVQSYTTTSGLYNNVGYGAFHAIFDSTETMPANSAAYLRLQATDTLTSNTRTLTFKAYKGSLGIVKTSVSEDEVVLYPNPARESVNVVYSPNAGVKNIAVYNLIGKVVKVFRPIDDNSAKLDIDNIPTGVYFVRLMDANGHVLATRRFTRQ